MNLLPFYHKWYNMTFPHNELPNGPLVLQLINIIQDRKDSGHCWYIRFKEYLEQIGFVVNTWDGRLFILTKTSVTMYLLLSTDDFLIVTGNTDLGHSIIKQINTVYLCTSIKSSIIKYLNLQMIQSHYTVTMDQTRFILDFMEKWFPKNSEFSKINQPF